jgi:hypothetical protein
VEAQLQGKKPFFIFESVGFGQKVTNLPFHAFISLKGDKGFANIKIADSVWPSPYGKIESGARRSA